VSDEVVRRLREPGATFEAVRELVSGKAGAELLKTGDLAKGIFWAGMVQGLIHDIPSCKELITRIVAEAEAIIRGRLGAMLG
jgi:NAD(P)H-dependent flavin oxidoreductase YrpB (nitropropane dioxygenase family)